MEPIKLYVGSHYKEPKLYTYTELLFPFWGITAKPSMPYVRAAALQYQYSKNDFALVDHIKDADYVLMPYPYERLKAVNPQKVEMIVDDAKRAGKPLIIDGAGDIEHPIHVPNAVVLRIGQYQYSKKQNEITIPCLSEDLLESYCGGEMRLRKKHGPPSVGFAGWAKLSFRVRFKTWLRELPLLLISLIDKKRGAEHKGVLFRERTLQALSRDSRISTRFKARTSYSGHEKTIGGTFAQNRKEFIDTILGSDYALCIRGDANASVRFYEALSLGRIPLLLDTACVLPLEDVINYRDFCVFVDWRDLNHIGDILLSFHAKVSPEQFADMQRKARDTYKNYLRIDAFSKQLARMLKENLKVT